MPEGFRKTDGPVTVEQEFGTSGPSIIIRGRSIPIDAEDGIALHRLLYKWQTWRRANAGAFVGAPVGAVRADHRPQTQPAQQNAVAGHPEASSCLCGVSPVPEE